MNVLRWLIKKIVGTLVIEYLRIFKFKLLILSLTYKVKKDTFFYMYRLDSENAVIARNFCRKQKKVRNRNTITRTGELLF